MHLHAHIRECIEDFGPTTVFWLFLFEHFNGILGRQPNNNYSPEVQIMHRFTKESSLYHLTPSDQFQSTFSNIYPLSRVPEPDGCVCTETTSIAHWTQMTTSDLTLVEWAILI